MKGLGLIAVVALSAAAAGLDIEVGRTQENLLHMRADGTLDGPLAVGMTRPAPVQVAPEFAGGGVVFASAADTFRAPEATPPFGPAFSAGAWVAIESPRRWGGIVGSVEDAAGFEKGWILGYDETAFTFGLSTEATDDGDGKYVWIRAATPFEIGQWHHVAATYDGEVARLWVDGAPVAESDDPGGALLSAASARLTIGGFVDTDEHHVHDGRLADVIVTDRAWSADEIGAFVTEGAARRATEAWTDTKLDWRVAPYLTWPRPGGVSVLAETTTPSNAELRVRAETETEWQTHESKASTLHEFALEGLAPDTKHFYCIVAQSSIGGREQIDAVSEVRSFRTAPLPDADHQALTFTVIGDTQTNGEVAARVSALAHEHRPDFVVHCGDLVDTGSTRSDWTETFFPSVRPLIEHAPLVPVLGNHEQDAQLYYDYMALPEPERWYALRYGHAEFFMIDGNRSLEDQSAQLVWLEGALRASTATWRFAVLHQPPYTSDSNDYGETAEGPSTRGDMNARNIVRLLEEHEVDICFSGHVHDYERTFPITGGAVVPYEEGGVIYITAAGGGGSLEDFDGTNTWFGHKKMNRHHFVHVALHGDHLELQAMDEDGRLFDVLSLRNRGTDE